MWMCRHKEVWNKEPRVEREPKSGPMGGQDAQKQIGVVLTCEEKESWHILGDDRKGKLLRVGETEANQENMGWTNLFRLVGVTPL